MTLMNQTEILQVRNQKCKGRAGSILLLGQYFTIHSSLVSAKTINSERRQRFHITKNEEQLVVAAYQACSAWDNILEYVKNRVESLPGNNLKTKEYYHTTCRKAAIKRIKRIVTQQRKRSESNENIQSTSMLQSIRHKDMRYAKKMTPKHRLESKDQRLSIAEQLSTSSDEEMIMGPSEEADNAMASASGTQQEAKRNKSTNEEHEHERHRPEKKKRRERNKRHGEACEAHTQMCKRAMTMMNKIENVLSKLDSSDSD